MVGSQIMSFGERSLSPIEYEYVELLLDPSLLRFGYCSLPASMVSHEVLLSVLDDVFLDHLVFSEHPNFLVMLLSSV